MEVKIITNTAAWDLFVAQQPESLFVQYAAYAQFYCTLGEEGFVAGVYDNGILVGGSVVVSTHARRGNFLFLPYGPVIPEHQYTDIFGALMEFLRTYAQMHRYDFVRVSPFVGASSPIATLYARYGFRSAPIHMLAETTWLLDIQKTDDELMAGMKKNHRNLIRRCEREGVRIVQTTDTAALQRLNDMHDATAAKHNFHRFSRAYIESEFAAYVQSGDAVIFEAYLPDGTLDASSVIMFGGTMGAYRHSASRNTNPKIPTSYLIQWHAIIEARRRGKITYNFWGIAPDGASASHPFAGITHFKKGFGGYPKDLLHCVDLPVTWRYFQTWIVETARRIKRGF